MNEPSAVSGYSVRDVARMLGLTAEQVRSYVRAGILDPARGPHGEYRFSFRDLVLLRTVKGLEASEIPRSRVRRVLRQLRERLSGDESLSQLQMTVAGGRVVVRSAGVTWNPESGQGRLDFDQEIESTVALHTSLLQQEVVEAERELEAEDWYELGMQLEAGAPYEARDAYRRTLELDPDHVDARINLGRLLHADGRLEVAETHYRKALAERGEDATALFNLAVCVEDQERWDEAIGLYEQAIRSRPGSPDPHYNLARLYEKVGNAAAAFRHLRIYRRLSRR
jgi:tetratricopeptide (TPR) repeat protein